MKKPTLLMWPAVIALVLVCVIEACASAQVIENRRGEANPGEVLFHTTLYGAGTGLLLSGSYALVKKDGNPSTGDVLRWGIAGGAGVGFLIGLIYLMGRPQPKSEVEIGGPIEIGTGISQLGSQRLMLMQERDGLRPKRNDLELRLVTLRF